MEIFSKALINAKENQNVEITKNQSNITDISEENLKNNANDTIEKNEDPSVPIKPSDPSDPSADLGKPKQGTEAVIKPENSPTHALEASPLSPQFQCYYCRQCLPSQSELIAHMDKESETHRTAKEIMEFKDKGVHEIIKEYLGGID